MFPTSTAPSRPASTVPITRKARPPSGKKEHHDSPAADPFSTTLQRIHQGIHAAPSEDSLMKTAMTKLGLAMTLALAATASHAVGPRPAPLDKPVTLTVGYVKVGHLSPMIFVEEDLKQCNVNVQPAEFVRYADARTALLSGSVDVAGVGPADLAIALAQGSNKLVGL